MLFGLSVEKNIRKGERFIREASKRFDLVAGKFALGFRYYNGIGVDPSDGSTVWIYSEYATDVNTWGTWLGALTEEEPDVLYKGPDSCIIAGGAFANTDDFPLMPAPVNQENYRIAPLRQIPLVQDTEYLPSPAAPAGSNIINDMSTQIREYEQLEINQPNFLIGFEGIPDAPDAFGYVHIPPDPIMAAGPEHVIGCVNSNFAIFDKSGTMLKQIDGTLWFENVLPGLGAGEPFGFVYDPQIVYDHHADRWVMLYIADNNASESYLLISTSDDANPFGAWCNFAIPGHQNGCAITTNMNDYPKLGVDDQAFYVTANMFDLSTGYFQYVQVRILEKSQFYNNTCGHFSHKL